ncbi:nuclear transport factor 2 family protein [Streptomyces sp. NPDC028635]|uniref:nuclear transport factor 2 family protein n=1 Tax=Streptomyces sp. NPDC028635 TaxID=3154800 RepID=UPI0033F6CE47
MTSPAVTSAPTPALAGIYPRVQQFYAAQVRHLDGFRAEEFAATFTEDGVFDHRPGTEPLVGREAIAGAVLGYQRTRHAADPVQRRHWFNMLEVFPQDDGTLRTEYYALVLHTRPGTPEPQIGPSCFVTDILTVTDEDGEPRLLTKFRRVRQDHLV